MVERELPKLLTAVRFRSPALHRRGEIAVFAVIFVLAMANGGCAQYVGSPEASLSVPSGALTHRVAPGETLWRIANEYQVEVSNLARVNRISDASQIQAGQLLVIPSAFESTKISHLARTKDQTGEDFVWPVEGKVVSVFGMRRGGAINKGIDIQAARGKEVVASRSGWVSFIHEGLPGFGKTIIVDHGDGFASVYAYMEEILVRKGEQVTQRQVIARVGDTGRTDVPALHFEIRRNQKPENPFYYLP